MAERKTVIRERGVILSYAMLRGDIDCPKLTGMEGRPACAATTRGKELYLKREKGEWS
jgi:hypothetical protein